jgi:uncharacterized protein YegL
MSERVTPFYLVCDESYSMSDHLDALNGGLRELHYAIGTDPMVAERTRFCLIGFSSTAEVLWQLKSLGDATEITPLRAKAATCFGRAFTLLRETIEKDVGMLEADGHRVCRPVVFFLSDGQPTDPDDWPAAFDWLMEPLWPVRPHVIAMGIGDAEAAVIASIGTFRAFMSTADAETALRGFCRALTTSMVESGTSVAESDGGTSVAEGGDENGVGGNVDGNGALLVPEHISGFTALDAGVEWAGLTPDPHPIHRRSRG